MSFVFCVTLVVYNQAAVALAATAESRYTFYIVPPLLAAVTMGLQALASGAHQSATSSLRKNGKVDRLLQSTSHALNSKNSACGMIAEIARERNQLATR